MTDKTDTSVILLDIEGEISTIKDKADQLRFENYFNDKLNDAIKTGQALWIDTFGPFSKHQHDHLLVRLLQADIPFRFKDFPLLDRQMLESLLQVRSYTSTKRSKKKDGRSQLAGNPNLGEERIRLKSARKRKRKGLIDRANLHALRRIKELRDEELSLATIAERLSQEGITTSKGKSFHAQTVSRLIDNEEMLRQLFLPQQADQLGKHEALGLAVADRVVSPRQRLEPVPLLDSSELVFEDIIELRFAHPLREEVELVLYHKYHYQEDPIKIPAGTSHISIDVLRDTALYPGVNIFELHGKQVYKSTEGTLILFASLRPEV